MDVMHERVMSLIPERRGGVKEFAEKIGVPANLVSMWRKGDSFSYKNYLSKISYEYNVSIDWLCGNVEQKENLTDKPGEVSEKDIRLINWFRSLPAEKQKAILISQDAPEDVL